MKHLFISILIPTFRRPEDLRNCLKSVAAQKWKVDYEIIVSENDHSNELTVRKILEEFSFLPIKIFFQKKNLGMFGNWNFLIEEAAGEYFSLLNDDDILLPNWTHILNKADGHKMLGVPALENTATNKLQNYENDVELILKDITLDKLYWGLWTNGTLGSVFNTDASKALGLFDPDLYPISDWDFYVRYIEKHGGKISSNILALFGRDESESTKVDTMLKDMEQSYLFRDHLIKKRKLKYNFKMHLIKNMYYAKKYSICRSKHKYKSEHQFPNAILSFAPTRLLLRIFPMRLAKFFFM